MLLSWFFLVVVLLLGRFNVMKLIGNYVYRLRWQSVTLNFVRTFKCRVIYLNSAHLCPCCVKLSRKWLRSGFDIKADYSDLMLWYAVQHLSMYSFSSLCIFQFRTPASFLHASPRRTRGRYLKTFVVETVSPHSLHFLLCLILFGFRVIMFYFRTTWHVGQNSPLNVADSKSE